MLEHTNRYKVEPGDYCKTIKRAIQETSSKAKDCGLNVVGTEEISGVFPAGLITIKGTQDDIKMWKERCIELGLDIAFHQTIP